MANGKKFIYYASLVCPIIDILKAFVIGIYDGISQARSEYQELKQKSIEEVINHKSVLNIQKFDRSMDNEKNSK